MTVDQLTTYLWFIGGILAGGIAVMLVALAVAVGRDTFARAPVPTRVVVYRIPSEDGQTWVEMEA